MNIALSLNLATDAAGEVHERELGVRVHKKYAVADDVVALELVAVNEEPLPSWTPGAHVDVMIDGVASRQYSLSGDPADTSFYRLGVLRDEAGKGSSRYIHDTLMVGDEIRLRGPRNHFELRTSTRYIFVAGGIGVTPILPMVRSAEKAGAEMQIVYGGRTRRSMAFVDEIVAYGDRALVRPQDEFGLLDLEALLGTPSPDTLVYCCGPEPLLAAVESQCHSWPVGSLRVERFVPRPVAKPDHEAGFEVQLAKTGKTLQVGPDESILEVVRKAGIHQLSSCEEGTCGTCETNVLDGEVDHRDSVLDEDERATNDCMMICVSRARGERLVLDL